MVNHSCSPNCVMTYERGVQVMRCCRDVKAGEELTVAYLDVGAPSWRRREELKSSYFFHCRCTRCEVGPTSPPKAHVCVRTTHWLRSRPCFRVASASKKTPS